MNRRVLAAIGVGLVAIAAGAGLLMFSARPEPAPTAVVSAPRPALPEGPSSPQPPVAIEPSPVGPRPTSKPRERSSKTAPETARDTVPEASPVAAAPTTATLRIDSDVAGAEVFLDRVFLGVTPLEVSDVKPGTHRLNVSATGFEGISETIDVVPGPRDVMVEFKAVRLNASIRVRHKHGMGSCEGTLSATPDGLRYETTNRADAFSVALTGVEAFTVDYLAKNLRLRVKSGKTYNFTDPDGNADRLFVFHRDVDKARARLSQRQ